MNRRRGPGILSENSEIVSIDSKLNIRIVAKNRKDFWPFTFQFGAVSFPSGKNSSGNIAYYNLALNNNDLSTIITSLDEI